MPLLYALETPLSSCSPMWSANVAIASKSASAAEEDFGNVQIASIDGTRPRSKETAAAIVAIMSGASDPLRR